MLTSLCDILGKLAEGPILCKTPLHSFPGFSAHQHDWQEEIHSSRSLGVLEGEREGITIGTTSESSFV